MGLSRTELFAAIRRGKRLDPEMLQRVLAEKYGVRRRTVRQALLSAVPPPLNRPVPRVIVLDPAKPWIDAMLREDAGAPRKQKHTRPAGSIRVLLRGTTSPWCRTPRSVTTCRPGARRSRPRYWKAAGT